MKKYLFPCLLLLLVAGLFWQRPSLQSAQASSGLSANDGLGHIAVPPTDNMRQQPVWRALLLVYYNTAVDYIDEDGVLQHLTTSMTTEQMATALWSFRQLPSIAHDFSNGEAIVEYDIIYIDRPVDSLTLIGQLPNRPDGDTVESVKGQPVLTAVSPNHTASTHSYWLSPANSRLELDTYAPPGKYDSIFVHWASCDFAVDQCVTSQGWGWGLYATDWANGATYATVSNAPDWMWQLPTVGEVWLHEWLHGASPFYEGLGYPQPQGNADGGGSHGYLPDPQTGWSSYYRDLMTGQVWEPLLNQYTGITAEAWRSRSLLGYSRNTFVDYFYADTTATYDKRGNAIWNAATGNIRLGLPPQKHNRLYKIALLYTPTIVSGRVYVPATAGTHDTVALAVHGGGVEFAAILPYGTQLEQQHHIALMQNDDWGELYPMTLTPGWYNIDVAVNQIEQTVQMRVWPDGVNEPEWQLSRPLPANWIPKRVGFRTYGLGTLVDEDRKSVV